MSDSIDEYIATDITDVDGIDVQADGRRLPFRDDSFDTIILSAVLEHIPIQDVGDIIAECHRILSSGGYLVAYVPFIYPLHGEPYDFYRPTKYGLHSLLESGGFDVTIHTGGGFGEAILHVSHLGCRSLVRQTGITELLLPIVPLHYLGLMTSKLLRRLLTRKMKFYDNWYVGQFVLGQV
jgi:SAM-dependent methyltransferase